MHIAVKLPKKLQVYISNHFIKQSYNSIMSKLLIIFIYWAKPISKYNNKQ